MTRRLLQFALADPDALAFHDEPIFRDGALVGRLTSAGYGHTLGAAVGLGYVTAPAPGTEPSWYRDGRYEIEIACEKGAGPRLPPPLLRSHVAAAKKLA